MLRCRARGEHESHGLPWQIRADSIHRVTASRRTQRAEINWEAGGAWGGRAMGRGDFSPCVSGSAELGGVASAASKALPPLEQAGLWVLTGDHTL